MGVKHNVTATAQDGAKGMTLAEVENFVQAARGAGADGDTHVKADIGFRGQLKKLEQR